VKITDRDKRFLAFGGLSIVVYFLITLVISPIYATQVRKDREIQNKIRFIEKYYEVLNQKTYYEQKSKQNEEVQKSLSQRFLDGKKPGIAAANLQKILEGFASKSAIKIDRVRVEKHKFTESLMIIPIEITLRSSLKNLTQFIYKVESFEKFLVIEKLNSRRINKTDPELLQATLLISGFILNGEPEGTKKT
jgi:ribosome-binding ATPase YchF (GTP1/OBG family)